MKLHNKAFGSVSSLVDDLRAKSFTPRRRVLIAAAACIALPLKVLADKDATANNMQMALDRPCRVLPGLESKKMPEWLCRAGCKVQPLCLNC